MHDTTTAHDRTDDVARMRDEIHEAQEWLDSGYGDIAARDRTRDQIGDMKQDLAYLLRRQAGYLLAWAIEDDVAIVAADARKLLDEADALDRQT